MCQPAVYRPGAAAQGAENGTRHASAGSGRRGTAGGGLCPGLCCCPAVRGDGFREYAWRRIAVLPVGAVYRRVTASLACDGTCPSAPRRSDVFFINPSVDAGSPNKCRGTDDR